MSSSRNRGKAPALSHTKSRRGCLTCKKRKVKCDESRPSCTACARHKVPCEYVTPAKPTRSEPRLPSSNSTSSITSDQSMNLESSDFHVSDVDPLKTTDATDRRLLELRLLHHFVTSTIYENFPSAHDPEVLEMWRVYAPKLAFKHSFFLNAILSVALLHLTKLDPGNEAWTCHHREYFDATVSEYRKEMDNICPQNAEAVCLAASVISLTSVSLLHKRTPTAKYSPPLQYLSLLSGSRPVYIEALPMIPQTSMIMSLVTAAPNMNEFRLRLESSQEKHLALFSHLTNWTAPNEIIDPESQNTYDRILSFIGSLVVSIENEDAPSETRRIATSFSAFMPQTYPKLLQQNNPRALVILAHYFCLYKAVDNVWWMRGIAEREVFGIQSILPEQWQWAMAWPLQKLAFFAASAATANTAPLPV